MKTTNQSQEKCTLVLKTRKSVIYFGILSVLFITTSFGSNASDQLNSEEQKVNIINVEADLNSNSITKPEVIIESESELTESIAVITTEYIKPTIEIIKENEQIIESNEEFDFESYFGRGMNEIIQENEMIIESDRIDEAVPLNTHLINNYSGENKEGLLIKNDEALKS